MPTGSGWKRAPYLSQCCYRVLVVSTARKSPQEGLPLPTQMWSSEEYYGEKHA